MAAGLCLAAGALILIINSLFTRGVTYGTGFQPVANLPANGYGVNVELDKIVRDEDLTRSIDLISGAGFGFARQVFAWNEIEISAKGDYFDHKNGKAAWDKYDRLVDAGNAAGLQFIARLERPPDWARAAGTLETAPPINLEDYGDFVAAFVTHFKGRVHYVQIWNEPNRFEDWGDQPVDPTAYTRMLQTAYRRAKEVDPTVVVLSAALTPTTDCCVKNRPDPVYLQQMYDAGARGSFDVLGAQGYGLRAGPEDPWQDLPAHPNEARKAVVDSHNTNFGRVVLDRQVMVRNGDAGKPVWMCEFGWNALPAGWQGDASPWGSVSLEQQAAYTSQAFQRARAEWPWLGVMNVWLFQDPAPAANDPTQFFGLVDQQFQPRPVYSAIAALAHIPAAAATGEYAFDGPAASYAGTWSASGRGRASPVSGATATLRFVGSVAGVRMARGPNTGIAYLTVDGSPTYATEIAKDSAGRAAIDLYALNSSSVAQPVAAGLPYGAHELTVTVSGLQGPSSSGPAVEVDGFSVGLTADQRPLYGGGLLLAAGAVVLGWLGLGGVSRRLRHGPGLDSATADSSLDAQNDRAGARRPLVWLGLLALGMMCVWRGPLAITALGATVFLAGAIVAPELALVFVPLAAPFYLYPTHVRGAELPLTEVAIALNAVGYLLRSGWRREWHWPKTAFAWPAAVFFVAASASVLAAEFPRYALREWRTDALEPLLFFALVMLVRPRVKWMLDALLLGGGIVAMAGVIQYARHNGIQAEGVLRMVGVYRSPDNFALYLGRVAPIALALALLAPLKRGWRAGYAAVAALSLAGVLLSFTRGAWLGDFLAILLVAGFAGRRWLAGAVFGGAVAAAAISSVQARRVQSLLQFQPGSTGYSRIELWRATLAMIRDHPIFGVGLDNFLYQYPRYILPDARNEPDLSHPHNLVLDFWSRIGIFGLASLVWLEVVFFRKSLALLRTAKGFQRAAVVGLGASMVDCLAHGLVDNSYFLIDLSVVFWLSLALVQLLEWGSPQEEETAA